MRWLDRLRRYPRRIDALEARMLRIQEAVGRVESRQVSASARTAAEAEFSVFSQGGEDGIIHWLTTLVPIDRQVFVEFGVEDYSEANTRFLLAHRNWSGTIFDSSQANIEAVRRHDIYWRHDLQAAAAFITRENINGLLQRHGVEGDIGLLSIDVDGNDYWIWQAMDVISPRIVAIEYNSRLGPLRAVSMPYQADFARASAHHSMLYYGASLRALWKLGRQKGYDLVCCNTAGNNAFFVRTDVIPPGLQPAGVEDAYVRAKFRESRDADGRMNYLSFAQEEQLLASLEWIEV